MRTPILVASLIALALPAAACSDGMWNPFEGERERAGVYANDADVRARRSERFDERSDVSRRDAECELHYPATDYTAETCPSPDAFRDETRGRMDDSRFGIEDEI